MKKFIAICLMSWTVFTALGAEGDTVKVKVHDAVDLTWYGRYDQMGHFPITGKTYRKALLHFTMGCSSTGCSHWDYTVHLEMMKKTGAIDSNIISIDTVTNNPLVLDTTWNVFDVLEAYELGRAITPYGTYMNLGQNGFNNNWEFVFTYDITDYVHLFEDSTLIRVFYSGWQNGFSATMDFHFIEGTPPREVLDFQNVYYGSWGYANTSDFENNQMPAQSVDIDPTAQFHKVRVTPSGHGFDNDVNCAEFCEKEYLIKVNGGLVASGSMWKDDCGLNPVYPQGGTWIYDRANWCPGDYVPVHEHDVTPAIQQGTSNVQLDFDIEAYTWSGNQTPSHSVAVHLVSYGDFAFQNDAEILEIVAPSSRDNHNRWNPICTNPRVQIRNNGQNPLTSVDIKYWVEGGSPCWYTWTGNLAYGETFTVTLPTFDWSGLDPNNTTFHAELSWANEVAEMDEYDQNDRLSAHFELPPMYEHPFEIYFRTNNRPEDNYYNIYDESGTVVQSFTPPTTATNTLYRDTVDLDPGCYVFEIWDIAKNGLADWPTGQGDGTIQLRNFTNQTPLILNNFNRDFGTRIRHEFMVDYEVYDGPAKTPCEQPIHNSIQTLNLSQQMKVFPNPASDQVSIELLLPRDEEVNIEVTDVQGKIMKQFVMPGGATRHLNVSHFASGIYIIKASTDNETANYRINVTR